MRIAGRSRAPAQRHQHRRAGRRSAMADRRQHDRQRQAAPAGGLDRRRGRTRRRASARRTPRAPRPTAPTSHGFQNGAVQLATSSATISTRRDQRAPLLLERIAAEEDQPVLLGDHAPAGAAAARGPAGVRCRARTTALNTRPVEKRRQAPHERRASTISVAERVLPVAEEVALQPGDDALGAPPAAGGSAIGCEDAAATALIAP